MWKKKLLTINLLVDNIPYTYHLQTNFPRLRTYIVLSQLKRNGRKVKIISILTSCKKGKPLL